jgi:hypothetical protein
MWVRVLGFDCTLVGDFEVKSYTIYADGNLRLDMADGSDRTLGWEEWMDIRQVGIADEWAKESEAGAARLSHPRGPQTAPLPGDRGFPREPD